MEIVEDYTEKVKGLNAVMKHATGKEWSFQEEMINAVCVFKEVNICHSEDTGGN